MSQPIHDILYSQEPRPCKKHDCPLCLAGKEHPPYWFATTLWEGTELHLYLGAEFRPVSLADFQKAKPQPKAEASPHASPEAFTKAAEAIPEKPRSAYLLDLPFSAEDSSTHQQTTEAKQATTQSAASQGWTTETLQAFSNVAKAEALAREAEHQGMPSEKEFFRDLRRFKMVRLKDVKMEYRQLIKKYHPDQFGIHQERVQEWMKIINVVHDTHMRRMQRFR